MSKFRIKATDTEDDDGNEFYEVLMDDAYGQGSHIVEYALSAAIANKLCDALNFAYNDVGSLV